MKLKRISLSNFKGIKSESYQLNGDNYTIAGKNGTGKTSIFDGYMWLLFGKNSDGKSAFDVRPHDDDHNAIPGLVVGVEAVIEYDGVNVTLKKENTEKAHKGIVTGYESSCWINEVPTKVGEFNKYISEIIAEDKFKILTDLSHFNNIHWSDRRKMLLEIAGDISSPDGFESLVESMASRSVDDYKKVLTERRKGFAKDQSESTPRIDELTRSLDSYSVNKSVDDLQGLRTKKESMLTGFSSDRLAISKSEAERSEKIDQLNKLKTDKILREAFLESDTSNVQKYVDEKQNLTIGTGKIKMQITDVNNNITSLISEMKVIHSDIISTAHIKNLCIDQIDKLESKDSNDKAETCPKCGFVLNEEDVLKEIARLNELGKNSFMKSNSLRNTHEEKQAELIELQDTVSKYMISLNDAEKARTDRFTAIDEMLTQRVGIAPADDSEWVEICKNINTLENQIGDSIAEKVIAIDEKISSTNQGLADINKMLSDYDNANKTISRIAEIEQHEMELGQKIIEIEGELSLIAEYKTAQNNIISESVNKMFKYVTFRMFKKNIGDDGVTDDCTAIYRPNGTAYPDCSTGEKIIIGIDIINTSSDYFDLSVPLFIDNAESLTKPIDRKGQFIRLVAEKGVDKLIVEKNK